MIGLVEATALLLLGFAAGTFGAGFAVRRSALSNALRQADAVIALLELQRFAEAMEQRASKEPSFYEAAGAYGDMAAQIRARIRRIEDAGCES